MNTALRSWVYGDADSKLLDIRRALLLRLLIAAAGKVTVLYGIGAEYNLEAVYHKSGETRQWISFL